MEGRGQFFSETADDGFTDLLPPAWFLIAVWSEYCTKVKQNCLCPLVSEITLLNRLLTRAEEPHQGANMRIFTFVLTSLCSRRSKALGKLPVDRALHRPDYHLSKYSKGREACASHSFSLSPCTASD